MKLVLFKSISLVIILLTAAFPSRAQMSGAYYVPGDFASLAAAVASLNSVGISGGTTVNILGGYTETVTAGGLSLTATGTAASNLLFKKDGFGANPRLMAYTGGTATPVSSQQDGIFRLIGCDFVTIDGLDLQDVNTSNPATMEFGYGFFKASAADGCNNNIIRNCTITLNKINNTLGVLPAADGSRGIDLVNALSATHTIALTPTVTSGASSNNCFYGNRIENCNIGIALIGFAALAPYLFTDLNNEVGGPLAVQGNTIVNFGGGGNSAAAAGVMTQMQTHLLIRNNLIVSNDGNGISHAAALRGIYMTGAHSGTTSVLNNTVTLSSGGTTALQHPIENTAGVNSVSTNIIISNNLIANCTYSTATSGAFRGVYNLGQPSVFSVSNNTFINNSTAATSGTFANIFNSGQIASSASYNNNQIHVGTFNANSTSLTFYGIFSQAGLATCSLVINQNSFQNINYTGAIGGTGFGYMIYSSATSLVETISGNTFNNLNLKTSGGIGLIYNNHNTPLIAVTNNSVVGGFTKTVAGGVVLCYSSGLNPVPSGSLTFAYNNFSNFTLTAGTGFYGTQCNSSGVVLKIENNVFNNINTGNAFCYGIKNSLGNSGSTILYNTITNFSITGGVRAIDCGGITGSLSVEGNTVSGLTSASGLIYGMDLGASHLLISKNKIANLAANGSASQLYGIYLSGGSALSNTTRIYNNLLGDFRVTSASGPNPVMGISLNSNGSFDVAHNTIYFAASSSGANFGSYIIYINSQLPHTLRNNIFINNSIASGTGRNMVLYRSNPNLPNFSGASNNNIYFVGGTPGPNNAVMFNGTTAYPTLAAYQSLVAPRETASYYENTAFSSTLGSSPGFLRISNSPASFAESNGLSLTEVTDDIDQDIRFGNPGYTGTGLGVDIGADEYNGTVLDSIGPAIAIASLGLVCTVSDRTLTASFSDISGVGSGSVAPRIYFRKNNNPFLSAVGVFASGTASNSIWNFTISAAAMGGLSNSDVVSYFIVAQDNRPVPNVISYPFGGLVANSVNSITTAPLSPDTYTIAYLGGVYTVGSGGYFPTLTNAAQAYNASCLVSSVDFVLLDLLYSPAESFPVTFQNNVYASAINSLAIYPANAVSAVIAPSTNSEVAVIKFLDARFISLDGKNTSGRAISIVNSNTTTTHAGIWLASSVTGCSNINLQNLSLTGGNNTITAGSHGVIACSNVSSPLGGNGSNNDNVTLSGLRIERYTNGISSIGSASVTAGGNDNWTITNCQIGPVVPTTSANLRVAGIILQNTQLSVVRSNTVSNVTGNATQSFYNYGIALYVGTNTSTITANRVTGINYTGFSAYGAVGLEIQVNNLNSNILISNNMISDVNSNGGTLFGNGASAGVRIGWAGQSGGLRFYNNSIAMTGSTSITGNASLGISAALYAASTATNIEVVNTIFYSDIEYNFTGTRTYAIYSDAPATAFPVMNYNNYTTRGAQGVLARIVSATVNTLPNLQTAFGNNQNSQNIPVVFTATNDLHLVPAANAIIDNLGTPIAGIINDFDGQVRNASTPDIGADEFTSPNCNTVTASTISASNSGSICAGQSFTLTRSPYSNFLPGIQQSWQVGTSPGGPYTPVSAATSTIFNTPTLSSGIYYYVVVNTCTFSNETQVSNEMTLSVAVFPTVSVNSATSTICAGNNILLVASGASSYTWSPNNNLSSSNGGSVNASPAFTTTYLVSGSNPGGCTGPANTASITVNVLPAAGTITVSASSSSICQGAAINLQAAATSSVYGVSLITFSPIPTPTSGVGTLCSNGNVVTGVSSGWLDDGNWYVVNIPFSFNFFNSNYTGCSISTNGFVTFGSVVPNTFNGYGLNLPNFNAGRPSVGAVYGNLSFLNTGTITAFTSGSAPNRKFVVNWMNGQFQLSNTGTVTTQVILYETTNVVEVHTSRNTGQYAASQGIQDGSGSVAYLTPGRNNSTWSVGTSGDAYRWSPTVTYSWSPSTYLNAPSSSTSVASAIQSSIIYTAIATAVNGCKITGTVGINVTPGPTLSIAGGTNGICAGTAITLTASGAPTYTWSDGAQTAVVSLTPALTSTYVVSGKSATNNCVGTAVRVLTVNPLPSLSVTGNSAICLNQNSTLNVTGADSYSWTGIGTSSSITAVSQSTGTTTYSVSGTNTLTGCSGSTTSAVSVYDFPILTVSGNTLSCEGANNTISANGAGTYSWSTGATGAVILTNPIVSTAYSVTGFSSPANCSSQAVLSVSVIPGPTLVINGNTSFCSGLSSTLTVSGASNYLWSTLVQSNSIIVTPLTSSVFSVTGVNAINGCSSSSSVLVNVLPSPFISIGSLVNNVCPGESITFTAAGAATYTWSGFSQGGPQITVTPTATAIYTVVGAGFNNCVSSGTISMGVFPPVVLQIATSQVTVCEGEEITLSASGVNNIIWYPGNVIGGTYPVPPGPSASYTVVGRDNNNCTDTMVISVEVDACTGLSRYSEMALLRVFPNPSTGLVRLVFSTERTRLIEVMNLTGAVVMQKEIKGIEGDLNLTGLVKGLYSVRISGEKGSACHRIILE